MNRKHRLTESRMLPSKKQRRGSIVSSKAYRRVNKPNNKFIKGVNRTGGFYGRYRGVDGGGRELKFFDTANSFSFDTTGEVPATGQLALIPQDTTMSGRIGRKVLIKSMHIRGSVLYSPGTDTVGTALVYLYVVLDKQANGAAAAVTDVLTSNVMGSAMINMANSERFVILKRIVVKLQAGAGVSAAYGKDSQDIEFYHKCNLPIEYSSTTGAITEIKSNNLFLLAGNSGDAGTDDEVAFLGTCRLRYSDNS